MNKEKMLKIAMRSTWLLLYVIAMTVVWFSEPYLLTKLIIASFLPFMLMLIFGKKTKIFASVILLVLLGPVLFIVQYDTCGGFCFIHNFFFFFMIIILCNLFIIAIHFEHNKENMRFGKKCLYSILFFIWVLSLIFCISVRGKCYCSGAKPALAENNFKDAIKQEIEKNQVETLEQKEVENE